MGLHIGVDAWNLADDRRGIGRYVRMILSRWTRFDRKRIRTTLVIPERFTWFEKRRYLKTLDFGPLPVRHRESVNRCGFDALWFPWNGLSWTPRGVKVATIHDGFFFAWPPHDPAIAAREQLPVRTAAREASQIITDSHFSKAELIKFLELPADRIDVVHLGVDEALLHERHEPARFEGASRYVLFVGELESRKGIDTLLDAAARLPDAIREDTVVAIAGHLSERPDLHGQPVPPPPPGVRVELLGHVSDARLRSLYAGASAFIFPSRYEGFGLPVLEAMACGAPVIASDAASIPEAGGDAALYFPVGDPAALAAAIEKVFTDVELAGRLREAGLRRAAAMSWDITAEQTLSVFERVVKGARDARSKTMAY
jgi:glycosyltransferase involved in cell wall biosynthesis